MLMTCYPVVLVFGTAHPPSTAAVERGSSLMNNISTELRTLGQPTLDALMRISSFQALSGPDQLLTMENMEALVDMLKGKKNREM
ncbi:hypothetical protein DPMN_024955 [Dreissena polymorpha]|uniref:Uncharacterized protein n=1 Tax=Dreissena polymorpha TaxID=45954 RepID=A0A9D4LSD2_DREPO|nr:hypothetical protein DPMN_024955 [Dreissena polymorpha]